MKAIWVFLFALGAAIPARAAGVGAEAPPLELPAADGRPLQLAQLRGKAVYLDFWASWCAPCRKSFPWMGRMQERYGAEGLVVLAVNLDENRADAQRFLEATPARFTVLYDPQGNSARAWRVKGMPTSYLIGPDGKITFVHTGFREEHGEELEKEIRRALPRR